MIADDEINNIDVRHVVILDTDQAGDLYMERLFPMWCDVIVFTVEGKYPLDSRLRNRVLDELATNKNIYCMFYGSRGTQELNILSDRRLFLSNFLVRDLQMFKWQKRGTFEFDEARIMELCMVFCNTMYDTSRIQTYNFVIDQLGDNSSVKWYHQLIKS